MSYSIPTLRAGRPLSVLVANMPEAPVITANIIINNDCVPDWNITITGPENAELYYRIYPVDTSTPDPYCGDIASTHEANNTVTFDWGFSANGTHYLKAIACVNGVSSNITTQTFGGVLCLTSVSAPTISVTQISSTQVDYTVTRTEPCTNVYILAAVNLAPGDPSSSYNTGVINVTDADTYSGSVIGDAEGVLTTCFVRAICEFNLGNCTVYQSNPVEDSSLSIYATF